MPNVHVADVKYLVVFLKVLCYFIFMCFIPRSTVFCIRFFMLLHLLPCSTSEMPFSHTILYQKYQCFADDGPRNLSWLLAGVPNSWCYKLHYLLISVRKYKYFSLISPSTIYAAPGAILRTLSFEADVINTWRRNDQRLYALRNLNLHVRKRANMAVLANRSNEPTIFLSCDSRSALLAEERLAMW